MKKDFKTKIAEIAANIAEVDLEPEKDSTTLADKLKGLKASLASSLNSINTEDELANIIISLIEMMPNLKGKDATIKAGLRLAMQVMSSTPAVDKDAPGAMYDKMPIPDDMPLKEAFDRINRK